MSTVTSMDMSNRNQLLFWFRWHTYGCGHQYVVSSATCIARSSTMNTDQAGVSVHCVPSYCLCAVEPMCMLYSPVGYQYQIIVGNQEQWPHPIFFWGHLIDLSAKQLKWGICVTLTTLPKKHCKRMAGRIYGREDGDHEHRALLLQSQTQSCYGF